MRACQRHARVTISNDSTPQPLLSDSTSLHQQWLLLLPAGSSSYSGPASAPITPWTLRANARVLVITVESHRATVHRPGKAKATVQHFCTTFQLSTVTTQGSPPRNSEASTPTPSQGFCVSSPPGRSASLGACAILVQFLQETSVHERSLTNAMLIAYRCFPPFFRRVLDHGESVPWFTATPCIFCRWSRVFLPEYQRSPRKLPRLRRFVSFQTHQDTKTGVQRAAFATTSQRHV